MHIGRKMFATRQKLYPNILYDRSILLYFDFITSTIVREGVPGGGIWYPRVFTKRAMWGPTGLLILAPIRPCSGLVEIKKGQFVR